MKKPAKIKANFATPEQVAKRLGLSKKRVKELKKLLCA